MEAMLTALEGGISTAIPLMLVSAGAIAAEVITIPIAKKAYNTVVLFLGGGDRWYRDDDGNSYYYTHGEGGGRYKNPK